MATASLVLLGALAPGAGAQERPTPPQHTVVQPGAPGDESRTLTADDLVAPEEPRHTEADVLFMGNMIHHHAQALVMSRLAPERTDRTDLLRLASRIERAQGDEIALMRRWLELRDEEAPPIDAEELGWEGYEHPHRDHPPEEAGEHRMMAGMLTPEQFDGLAAARGEEFDRLFLELMIHHHQGALEMVDELLASPGAARGSDIYHFATDVLNDQQVEIARMRGMLAQGR